jgi:hypothetical protein
MAKGALNIRVAFIKLVFVKNIGAVLKIVVAVQALQKTHMILVGKVCRWQLHAF